MKIFLVCCLAITGALSLPQNEITGRYISRSDKDVITNSIESYDIDQKPTEYLPLFSLPLYLYNELLNMKPHQMRSVATMMKPLIKPVLTSVELQILTEFVDETLLMFKEDPEVKASLRAGVDSLQGMYENSTGEMLEQFLTWVISLYSDEETARSFSSLLSDISPTIRSWVVDPMRQYYRAFLSPTLMSLTKSLNSVLGDDASAFELARRNGRWSGMVDLYVEKISNMMSLAKSIMRETAEFLEKQDREDY